MLRTSGTNWAAMFSPAFDAFEVVERGRLGGLAGFPATRLSIAEPEDADGPALIVFDFAGAGVGSPAVSVFGAMFGCDC